MASALAEHDSQQHAGRLAFLTGHLYQLQTLRWVGLHLTLILSPAFFFLRPWQGWLLAGLLATFTALWFLVFSRSVRRRFGRTELSSAQRLRLRFPSRLLAVVPLAFLLGHVYCRYILHIHGDDFTLTWWLALWMLAPVADSTNPSTRRCAYAIAFAILVLVYMQFAFWTPMEDWRGALAFSSLGLVLLVIAIFDFTLLCRTVRENAPERRIYA